MRSTSRNNWGWSPRKCWWESAGACREFICADSRFTKFVVEEIFICGVPYTHTFIPSLLDPFFLRVYMEHRVQVAFSDQFEVFGCARRGAGSSIYIRFTFYNFHSRSLWIAILEVQTAQKARRHPRCR